ncbi:MAG: hypothetical protein ABEI52_12800, partial [Halobacteriaceae archaeon]
MSKNTVARWTPRFLNRKRRAWLGLFILEFYFVVGYFVLTKSEPSSQIRYLLYPFVWINVGLWAVLRTTPNAENRLHAIIAGGIAIGYFLLVMWIPGQIRLGSLSPSHLGVGLHHLRITWYSPGWGPIIAYDGIVRLYLVPFEVIGYGSLAYLVYANLLNVTRGVLSGALGLVTCVGCTVPVLAPLVGLLGGPASSLTTTAY